MCERRAERRQPHLNLERVHSGNSPQLSFWSDEQPQRSVVVPFGKSHTSPGEHGTVRFAMLCGHVAAGLLGGGVFGGRFGLSSPLPEHAAQSRRSRMKGFTTAQSSEQ